MRETTSFFFSCLWVSDRSEVADGLKVQIFQITVIQNIDNFDGWGGLNKRE